MRLFFIPLIRTGDRRNLATCNANQGSKTRVFVPPLRAGGVHAAPWTPPCQELHFRAAKLSGFGRRSYPLCYTHMYTSEWCDK